MKFPKTPAISHLERAGAEFEQHQYDYKKSGTGIAAEELGVDEHMVVKTLVMEDEEGNPFIVLMHGDRQVSYKEMARALNVRNVSSSSPRVAQRLTGYMVGGISPLGTRREITVYVEETILDLPKLYINAGRRGFIVSMKPGELVKALNPTPVNVAR